MPISFDLTGKNILVTGASSGIGRATAIAVAQAGAFVVLLGRNEERLAEASAQCGGRSATISYDLTADLDDIPKLMQKLAGQYGTFSGLVHAAGIEMTRPLRAIRAKNLLDTFITNAACGVMLVKGLSYQGVCSESGTSVIFLSSTAATSGNPALLCYAMSKGAVESSVKTLAIELVKDNIRVNCIAPAMIHTPMIEQGTYKITSNLGGEGKDYFEFSHPMGFGQPDDVAGAAVYLLSDASRYVTGTTLFVDGGYTAQ